MDRRQFLAFTSVASLALRGKSASALDLTDRPIKVVVGFAAGGASDGLARATSKVADKKLHVPIVVENRVGAAGSIAASLLTREKPDGRSLGMLLVGVLVNQYIRKTDYDVTTDLTPIIMFGDSTPAVVVRADSKFKDFRSLLDYAKANPGMLKYGTGGVGSAHHLAMYNIGKLASVQWIHVPYKSGPESILALLAGDLDFIALTPEWVPMVADGRLRLLAMLSDERNPKYSDVPTVLELGVPIYSPTFYGLVGPKGMQPEMVDTLYKAYAPAINDPRVLAVMANFGITPKLKGPAEFKALILSAAKFYEQAAKGAVLE